MSRKRRPPKKDVVPVVYVTESNFKKAWISRPPEGARSDSLVLQIRRVHEAREENLAFLPLDALRLVEDAVLALQNGGYDCAERLLRLATSINNKSPFVAVAEQKGSMCSDFPREVEISTVQAVPTVFLNTVTGAMADDPNQKFHVICLARPQGHIEQFALRPHEALLMADALVRDLISHGFTHAKSVLRVLKENGLN